MVGAGAEVLYVGKAKSLLKRVTSYAKPARLEVRIRRMVAQTTAVEFVTTHTEAEALLLEANLIKRYGPRYNILLRDDKSFPSILLTGDKPMPDRASPPLNQTEPTCAHRQCRERRPGFSRDDRFRSLELCGH